MTNRQRDLAVLAARQKCANWASLMDGPNEARRAEARERWNEWRGVLVALRNMEVTDD